MSPPSLLRSPRALGVTAALLVAAAAAAGCGEDRPAVRPDAGPPPIVLTPEPRPADPEVPAGTGSLRLIRTVAVRLGPDSGSKRIGTIAGDTRVVWRDISPGPGCNKSWYALEPQGWVCGDYLEPSPRPPSAVELPRLDRGEMIPGTYGKVVEEGATLYVRSRPGKKDKAGDDGTGPVTRPEGADRAGDYASAAAAAGLTKGRPLLGSVNVRIYGELTSKGKVFLKVAKNAEEYLPKSHVREHKPSVYQGTRLGDDTGMTLPVAFVWPKGSSKAWTRGKPRGGGLRRQLDERTPVPVLESALDGASVFAYRVGDDEWIDARHVRIARPVPLPAGLKPGERWLDIDLDTQTIIAYEGDLPVYATMVSTGTKDTPTETGVYRVWKKVAETDMRGLSGEDPYSVATVPWTQFFSPEKGLALHTSYWHDKFGIQKSHGCVNLSPRDARWLYFFTDPQVPPGWSMAAGVVEAPGSIVRVRSKADPDPPVRGYAQKVDVEDEG